MSIIKTLFILPVMLYFITLGYSCKIHQDPESMPKKPIELILKKYTESLMSLPGVIGTAQGLCDDDTDCIKVYVVRMTDELANQIPKSLEGYPVDIEVTGEINALKKSKN